MSKGKEVSKKRKQCKVIIHGAASAAAGVGAGFAQIPLADNVVLTSIQIPMIISIGKVFDVEVSKSAATAFLSSAAAVVAGRSVSQVLWGWIPFVGNAINTATAAGLTEMIGWMAVKEFSSEKHKKFPKSNRPNEEHEASPEGNQVFFTRADPFLKGTKDAKTHKEEYDSLMEDLGERVMETGDPGLENLFQQLAKLVSPK